jgi:tetratricopeptide (TPR) repeat protein
MTLKTMLMPVLLTALTTALGAVDWRPMPATLVRDDGTRAEVLVFEEKVDEVVYSSPAAPEARGSLKTADIADIEYERPSDPDFNRGIGALRSQQWDQAIKHFSQAREKPLQYQAEQSARYLAEAYAGKGEPAKGAQAIAQFLETSPRHPDKPVLLARMADLYLQAGQTDQAQALVDQMQGLEKAYGSQSAMLALELRARIAQQQGQVDQAMTLLRQALDQVGPAAGRMKTRVGQSLLQLLEEHGNQDEILAVAEQLFYSPGDPTDIAAIHYQAAQVYDEQNQWQRAFDHYLIGVTMPGVSADVRNRSYGALLALTDRIERRDDIDLAVKQQYRTAASRL